MTTYVFRSPYVISPYNIKSKDNIRYANQLIQEHFDLDIRNYLPAGLKGKIADIHCPNLEDFMYCVTGITCVYELTAPELETLRTSLKTQFLAGWGRRLAGRDFVNRKRPAREPMRLFLSYTKAEYPDLDDWNLEIIRIEKS